MGNAGRFARSYRNKLLCAGNRWFHWDGQRWAASESGRQVDRSAKAIARDMAKRALASGDKDEIRWALRTQSRERIKAMIDLARPELSVPAAQLDGDPLLLNVLNGTLDLRTGILRKHDPADLITKLAAVTYDADAQCPNWLRFLDRVLATDAELIRGVQKMVGYSLTGDTREQVFFFLHGTGANGKTTFVEVLRALLGDYSTQAEFSTFLARRGDGPRNDIARLRGARFVAATEAQQDRNLDEAVVKSLTGGDTITARFLYGEFFEFQPAFKIWLTANHRPQVRGDDPAIWRRVRLVPFVVTIPDEERDPQLPATLAAELSGILTWAVEGCLAWQREGLGLPAAVRDATAGYRADMDRLAAFLYERCLIALEAQAGSTDLYSAYSAWCQARGEPADSQRVFSERLAAHDPGRIRKLKSNGLMVWRGIELRPDQAVSPAAEDLEAILG